MPSQFRVGTPRLRAVFHRYMSDTRARLGRGKHNDGNGS